MSSKEAVNASLADLTVTYTKLKETLDLLTSTEEMRDRTNVLWIGYQRIHSEMPKRCGVTTHRGQLVNGCSENLEGSLYILFEGNILRIRCAGIRVAMDLYLNGTEGHISINRDGDDKLLRSEPRRIGGETIKAIDETGVRIHDTALLDYENLIKSQDRERQIQERRNIFVKLLLKIFTKKKPEVSLVKPEPVYISHENLVRMADIINDGMKRTIEIIQEKFLLELKT